MTTKSKKTRTAATKTAVKKSVPKAPAKKAAAPAKKSTGAAALPGRYDNPLDSYSAYAQHRILLEKFGTDEAGQAKVFKHGTEVLGLPPTQVKTYIREKLNAILRDEQKKAGLHPSKPQLEKVKRGEFEPDFRYPNKEKATSALLAIVRRSGATDQAFHILTEGGKCAVVPAHVRPKGKPAPLKTGDIVMDTTIADSRAEVIGGGDEQSVIRYLTERKYAPQEQTVSNYYLHKIGTKASMKTELADLAEKKAHRSEAPVEKKAVPAKSRELAAAAEANTRKKAPAKKAVAKKASAKKAK